MKTQSAALLLILLSAFLVYISLFQAGLSNKSSSKNSILNPLTASSLDETTASVKTNSVKTDGSWLTQAKEQIASHEYNISNVDEDIQARNWMNDFGVHFSNKGLAIKSRSNFSNILQMQYAGLVREHDNPLNKSEPITASSLSFSENQVTLEHENDVQEWFINNEEGIEHGYNLYKRLEGDGRLLLTINVVKGEVIQNRDNIIIKLNDGRKIDYKKLVVLDNKKKILPASLIRTSAHQIQIGFDDSQAVYPIIVDPILSYTPDTILQYDLRVSNVSSAGDVNGDGYEDVIVSIRNADKTVFVYHGSANGIGSTFNTKLMGSGISVSGAGDVNGDGYDDVIVGNPYYSNSTGAARVYYGSPNGIDSTFSTLIEDHTHQGFGASVASAGDVNDDGYDDVIVGAPDYNGVTWFYGAAFVYHGSSSGVSTTVSTELIHICEATENHCTVGLSVSSAGDVNGDGYDDVIIGGHSSFYHTSQTYIHLGSANGVDSSFSTKLLGSGASVSSAGDVNGDGYDDIIVGAPAYDNLTGAAFVYHGSSNGINSTFSTRTQIEDAQQYLQLGSSVSSAGDVDGDGYDDVIVGASKFNGSATSTGAAFIHYGSANGISSTFSIQFGSTQEWAELGASVSGAGDINGDGYDDVIVSVPGELAAYIYQGYVDSDHDGVGDDSDTPPNDGSAIVDTDEAAPTPSSGGGSTGFRILLLALLMCGNRRRKPLD